MLTFPGLRDKPAPQELDHRVPGGHHLHPDPPPVGAPGSLAALEDVDEGGAVAEHRRPRGFASSNGGKENCVFALLRSVYTSVVFVANPLS